ncbi:MAG TPA: hypothetical protein VE733_16560 [Streptosporangiaceae bacterium]|nr:hypothetical protein [Streptosporangiaceae bacterium]
MEGVAVTDADAREAISSLAGAGLASGPSGAAAFAGARAALTGPGVGRRRHQLGITGQAVAVCICTEGSQ